MNRNPFNWPRSSAPDLSRPPRPLQPRNLPPGAVPGWPEPRLPELGGAVPYDPPIADVPPPDVHAILGAGDVVEHWQGTVTVDTTAGSVAAVYKTIRPWLGVDVFIAPSTPGLTPGVGALRVLIYAVANGVRALVAQSMIDAIRLVGSGANLAVPLYCGAARCVADSFEIELEAEPNIPALVSAGQYDVQVTVVASDKATALPRPNDTAIFRSNALAPFSAVNSVLGTGQMARVVGASKQPMFIAALHAVNTAAAARWLMVFDAGEGAVANGTAPLMSFAMTPSPQFGNEIHVDENGAGGELLRSQEFFTGPRVIASSTGSTLTATADVAMIGWVR